MNPAEVRVICYSGCHYAEQPREVMWEGRHLIVDRVISRGRTPIGPIFTVARGPEQFRLSYDEAADRWSVKPIAHPAMG